MMRNGTLYPSDWQVGGSAAEAGPGRARSRRRTADTASAGRSRSPVARMGPTLLRGSIFRYTRMGRVGFEPEARPERPSDVAGSHAATGMGRAGFEPEARPGRPSDVAGSHPAAWMGRAGFEPATYGL